MKTAALKAGGSAIGPMNRSEQSKFSGLDVAILAGLLLVTAAVAALVLGLVFA